MSEWDMVSLPKTVQALCLCGGVITGSQAKSYAVGGPPLVDHDWDIMIPFSKWIFVEGIIPQTAKPNRFLGWRFSKNGVEFDVWPDDLQHFLRKASRYKEDKVYAVDLLGGVLYAASVRTSPQG